MQTAQAGMYQTERPVEFSSVRQFDKLRWPKSGECHPGFVWRAIAQPVTGVLATNRPEFENRHLSGSTSAFAVGVN
jgi:hypothetical protein